MRPTARLGGVKTIAANLALAVFATSFVLVAVEVTMRAVPALLPAGVYGAGRYDAALDLNVHATTSIYNKVRYLERVPNRDGFLDCEHDLAKPAAVTRIGFFGDSYVESAQVPLDTVFFRQLAERLGRKAPVETLGFGISGWGTLHALRAYEVYGDRYALDAAVYVFVENDPGDELWDMAITRPRQGNGLFYGELDEAQNGYALRRLRSPDGGPIWRGFAKWAQRNSRLATAAQNRLGVLRVAGVQTHLDRDAVQMSGVVAGAVPDSNDLPSTWPEPYASRAKRLGELALASWQRSTAARGARFAVLYTPRGEDQLTGRLAREQTWLPWLEATCAKLGIALLDPSDALRARLEAGDAVYDDHWTPAGHEVIADVLASYFTAIVSQPTRP